MHERSQSKSPLFAAPYGKQGISDAEYARRRGLVCTVGAVVRCTHPHHGTFDGRVLGFTESRYIALPLTLEFHKPHVGKIIEGFTLAEFKDIQDASGDGQDPGA